MSFSRAALMVQLALNKCQAEKIKAFKSARASGLDSNKSERKRLRNDPDFDPRSHRKINANHKVRRWLEFSSADVEKHGCMLLHDTEVITVLPPVESIVTTPSDSALFTSGHIASEAVTGTIVQPVEINSGPLYNPEVIMPPGAGSISLPLIPLSCVIPLVDMSSGTDTILPPAEIGITNPSDSDVIVPSGPAYIDQETRNIVPHTETTFIPPVGASHANSLTDIMPSHVEPGIALGKCITSEMCLFI